MISNKLSATEVSTALHMIQSAERIVIFTHMSPDGDAMGSSLGLWHWISATFPSKSVSVIVPNEFPDFLAWMPGAESVRIFDSEPEKSSESEHNDDHPFSEERPKTHRTIIREADLLICTDFNEPKRIGGAGRCLVEKAQTGTPVLIIDHHILNSANTEVPDAFVISYPDSPSASELVYRLIHQIGNLPSSSAIAHEPLLPSSALSPLALDAATCLYTGMMTDTGNFSFNSNYPEMYEIVGDLVRLGVNKDAVYNAVFNAHTADRMRLVGYCLYSKMRIMPRRVALIALSRKELYRFNFKAGDAEGIVNMPLAIRDVQYSVFMREDKVQPYEKDRAHGAKTKVKLSFRSQGDHPVNVFAHEFFAGGGHMNAAGGEFFGSVKDAVALFEQHYLDFFTE